MKDSSPIRIAIIDDQPTFIETLKDHLSLFPEIEICGSTSNYKHASKLLTNDDLDLDLVFLDVEMPNKTGFELLKVARAAGSKFSVIFCTENGNFGLQAIRESAFDYIVKPFRPEELKEIIERFKKQRSSNLKAVSIPMFHGFAGMPEIIVLPTYAGIQFLDINRILMFRSAKSSLVGKSSWEVILTNETTNRLTGEISAVRILNHYSKGHFIQLSQSCIVNLSYLNMEEYKTHQCKLIPPYDKIELTVSRAQLSKLKDKFDAF
jgi:two-component system LytT family response regulator